MSGSKHSSASSSRSSGTIFKSREAIKTEYKERILNAFTRDNVFVEDTADAGFILTPNTDGLSIKSFVNSADITIFGVEPNSEILLRKKKYTVLTAVNARELKDKIEGLKERERKKTIVLVNGTDHVLLKNIQNSQVTCVKAIIWYNTTWRNQNFSEASILVEYPHLKKQYDEARGVIQDVTRENQERKKKEEELLTMLEEANKRAEEANKRAEERLERIRELEEEKEKTLKRNN